LGSPLPPRRSGALGVFRLPRVSRVLTNPGDHFLELGLSFRDPSGNRPLRPGLLRVRTTMAPPLDFRARPAFEVKRVGLEAGHSKSSAFPSRRFTRPQGFDPLFTVPPCFRWLTLFGFPLQSFLPPGPLPALVAPACPPRRFSSAGAVPVAWSCCLRKPRPRGFSLSENRYRRSRSGEGSQQRSWLSWSFRPSSWSSRRWLRSISQDPPPMVFLWKRASSLTSRTFGVFLPAPWRLGP